MRELLSGKLPIRSSTSQQTISNGIVNAADIQNVKAQQQLWNNVVNQPTLVTSNKLEVPDPLGDISYLMADDLYLFLTPLQCLNGNVSSARGRESRAEGTTPASNVQGKTLVETQRVAKLVARNLICMSTRMAAAQR